MEIPAGAFWMGSTQRDRLAYDDESPGTGSPLPRYYIARYPVTVAQFRAFDEASGRQAKHPALSLDGLPTHPVTACELVRGVGVLLLADRAAAYLGTHSRASGGAATPGRLARDLAE